MNKRKIVFIALVIIGFFIIVAAVFLYSHLVKIDGEKWAKSLGIIIAITLIFCGFLTAGAGVIVKEKRNKKCIFGIIIGAIGLAVLSISTYVCALAFIWMLATVDAKPFVYALLAMCGGSIIFKIGRKLFLRNRNPVRLQNDTSFMDGGNETDL